MLDDFVVEVLAFLHDLQRRLVTHYKEPQINGKGKRRTFCAKYGLPIQRVWHDCIDTFQGFNNAEMQEIKRQHKSGACEIILGGVTI